MTDSYTYAAGYTGYSASATTELITGMSHSGMTQSYAYDVNGRIVSWTCNGKSCTYEYDGIGQLIRVNDEKDTRPGSTGTSALRSKAEGERTEGIAARNPQAADRRACGEGTTWTYEYDNGGNITSRKKYAYTTGTVGALLGTIPYAYGDTVWKDKLTSYNGTAITSDGIGNFTDDGTWTYTWVGGRRLASMTKTGMSIAYLYDENGQRIKKSVTENGTTTVTDYTVCGKNVTHLHIGTDDLHIYYANGRPSHCKFNSSMYTYVYSLQGDVLGLKDSSGTLVVTYLYDAWGKEISRGGTLANTLGVINPFRYRGYVYDEETGLYYLRSRYYDPDIGRFISSDSILGQVGDLLQHNLFCYCGNGVIHFLDKNGCAPYPIFGVYGPFRDSDILEMARQDFLYATGYPLTYKEYFLGGERYKDITNINYTVTELECGHGKKTAYNIINFLTYLDGDQIQQIGYTLSGCGLAFIGIPIVTHGTEISHITNYLSCCLEKCEFNVTHIVYRHRLEMTFVYNNGYTSYQSITFYTEGENGCGKHNNMSFTCINKIRFWPFLHYTEFID